MCAARSDQVVTSPFCRWFCSVGCGCFLPDGGRPASASFEVASLAEMWISGRGERRSSTSVSLVASVSSADETRGWKLDTSFRTRRSVSAFGSAPFAVAICRRSASRSLEWPLPPATHIISLGDAPVTEMRVRRAPVRTRRSTSEVFLSGDSFY